MARTALDKASPDLLIAGIVKSPIAFPQNNSKPRNSCHYVPFHVHRSSRSWASEVRGVYDAILWLYLQGYIPRYIAVRRCSVGRLPVLHSSLVLLWLLSMRSSYLERNSRIIVWLLHPSTSPAVVIEKVTMSSEDLVLNGGEREWM